MARWQKTRRRGENDREESFGGRLFWHQSSRQVPSYMLAMCFLLVCCSPFQGTLAFPLGGHANQKRIHLFSHISDNDEPGATILPNHVSSTAKHVTRKTNVGSFVTSLGFCLAVVLSPWTLQVPSLSTLTVRASHEATITSATGNHDAKVMRHHVFPLSLTKSSAWAMTEEQALVDDVWRQVTKQFFDPTYNGQGEEGWKLQRRRALEEVASVGPDQVDDVYSSIRKMLSSLGDPYTRFLTPTQYTRLVDYARGTTPEQSTDGGIGVQLLMDPRSGKVVVVNTVSKGRAALAGIQPGDAIVSLNGNGNLADTTAEVVAAQCRGPVGSTLEITVQRPGDDTTSDTMKRLKVTRAPLPKTPSVKASVFTSEAGKRVGWLQVTSFSQTTVSQVVDALRQPDLSKISALVLDLRGNVGGYLPAGIDLAKLFLPKQVRIISEVDRTGRSIISINDGVGSDTETELYVLVDERTASASEIVAAALQDNGRATIVSASDHTFGKGRIQNLQELADGSGIAITRARYVTPAGRDLQGKGVQPDKRIRVCGPDGLATCLQGVL